MHGNFETHTTGALVGSATTMLAISPSTTTCSGGLLLDIGSLLLNQSKYASKLLCRDGILRCSLTSASVVSSNKLLSYGWYVP